MSSALGSPDQGAAGRGSAPGPSIPDYELLRIVGRGSYGDVWLARSVTGAWRAIKVVWRERFANAEPFEREFRGLKEFADVSLRESSQMTLLHVGRNDAAGFFYYVMELADDAERGRLIDPAHYVPLTLAEMRTRCGRIPADECARFGVEVARVLASLHRRGLVHRDVKPSNVILVDGVPKLADVGLVAPSATAQTFVGTEGYVPPEGPGAPSADVFALSKMLYELSTGHDRQEFPKLPSDLARLPDRAALLELNEIFLRACGPTLDERYRDGAAVLADLTALRAGVSLRTRRFTAFLRRCRRRAGRGRVALEDASDPAATTSRSGEFRADRGSAAVHQCHRRSRTGVFVRRP
jgi:serine/threonine protein kinase